RKVRAAEAAGDGPLAAALGEEQMLLPPAFELDRPALPVGEPDPVQVLELHAVPPLLADRLTGGRPSVGDFSGARLTHHRDSDLAGVGELVFDLLGPPAGDDRG